MKQSTLIMLVGGAVALGEGVSAAANIYKSTDRAASLSQYAKSHPIAAGVITVGALMLALPMIKKAAA